MVTPFPWFNVPRPRKVTTHLLPSSDLSLPCLDSQKAFQEANVLEARHPVFSLVGRTDSVTSKDNLWYGADLNPSPPSPLPSSVHTPLPPPE